MQTGHYWTGRVSVSFSICFCLFTLFILSSAGCDSRTSEQSDIQVDLSNHPIYSQYDFGDRRQIIHFGVQPLYLPTSLITESMKRDSILNEALAEQGLQIRHHAFLKGNDVNFFLKQGDLVSGVGGDMPAITAAVTSNIVVTSMIQLGHVSIVSNKRVNLAQLRRKRIGFARGSNAHYSLLNTLSEAGITEKQVRLIPLEVNEMPEALISGEISAFSA